MTPLQKQREIGKEKENNLFSNNPGCFPNSESTGYSDQCFDLYFGR